MDPEHDPVSDVESEGESQSLEEINSSDSESSASSYLSFGSKLHSPRSDGSDDSGDPRDPKTMLQSLYLIYKESINIDYEQAHGVGRKPSVEEFWKSYLINFVDPCGWIGRFIKYDWDCNTHWPVRSLVRGFVQVMNFNPDNLTVSVIILDEDNETEMKNGLPTQEECDSRELISDIFVWQLEPIRSVSGFISSIYTFKEALDNFRKFKLLWSLPSQKGMLAENWFEYGCIKGLEIQYDLNVPGAYSSQLREEIVSLLCSIRKLEEESEQLELTLPNDIDEDSEGEGDDVTANRNRLIYLLVELETLGNRLNHLTDPSLRHALYAAESQKSELKVEGIKEHHIVVVQLDEVALNMKLLENIKYVAQQWFVKNEISIDVNTIPFKILNSLNLAVTNCKPGALIVVGPGKHLLTGLGNLEAGGALIGLADSSTSEGKKVDIVTSGGTGDVWLLVGQDTDKVNLEIRNVNLVIRDGFGEKEMKQAIMLKSGSSLTLTDVTLENKGGKPFRGSLDDVSFCFSLIAAAGVSRSEANVNITAIEAKEGSSIKIVKCQVKGFSHPLIASGEDAVEGIEELEVIDCQSPIEVSSSVVLGPSDEMK